jgi:thymidylate synthase
MVNRWKVDIKHVQRSRDFHLGFYFNGVKLASPGSVIGFLNDLQSGKQKYPQTYQFCGVKAIEYFFEAA